MKEEIIVGSKVTAINCPGEPCKTMFNLKLIGTVIEIRRGMAVINFTINSTYKDRNVVEACHIIPVDCLKLHKPTSYRIV